MNLARTGIKKFFNEYLGSDEWKEIRDNYNKFDIIKIIGSFEIFLNEIQNNYNNLESNLSWNLSPRQSTVINSLTNCLYFIEKYDKDKLKQDRLLKAYDDFYWNVYDYFDDYGNTNETVCKEEFDKIIPIIKQMVDLVKK